LYGVDNNSLYSVGLGGGTTLLASLGSAGGSGSLGLAYDNASNTLYLSNSSSKSLYTWTAGATSFTFTTNLATGYQIEGLAILADSGPTTPESSTWLLAAMGLVAVAIGRSAAQQRG
jgi:opacity protein-like surface antigen